MGSEAGAGGGGGSGRGRATRLEAMGSMGKEMSERKRVQQVGGFRKKGGGGSWEMEGGGRGDWDGMI